MSARPWFKFFPADWRSDAALRMCSLAARGLWLEMVCLMDESDPRGYLTVKGKPVSMKQLAILAGCTVPEVEGLVSELEEAEVFSRRSDNTITSRRMVRETRTSVEQAAKVSKRWSVENSDLFEPGMGVGDTEVHTHILEARVQKLDSDSDSRASPREKAAVRIPEGFPDERAILVARDITKAHDVNVEREATYFRLHAETNDRKCKSWDGAWRTWITKSRDRAAPKVVEMPRDPEFDRRVWRSWMEDWTRLNTCMWDYHRRGPKPNEAGCRIPAEIMAEFGYVLPARAQG